MSDPSEPLRVVDVDPKQAYFVEVLGTKEKFWIRDGASRYLVKYPRPGSGEDWSEVIVCEIAAWLGIPHARYDLASVAGRRATITESFVPDRGHLIHGNELLTHFNPVYGTLRTRYRVSAHTISRVMDLVGVFSFRPPVEWQSLDGVDSNDGLFAGYLLLDALVGNTDRHDENWGLVRMREQTQAWFWLAPTFDHASSLGCHETDERKLRLLERVDRRATVQTYCEKARSAFFRDEDDPRPLGTLEAFREAAGRIPEAGRFWLDRLEQVTDDKVATLISRVPPDRMSEVSRAFARAMIAVNRQRLTALAAQTS